MQAKTIGLVAAIAAALIAGGCLCGQPDNFTVNQASGGLMEYSSTVHGGYSFMFNQTLTLDKQSSYDNTLVTALSFQDEGGKNMLFVGVLPGFISEGGGWLEQACDKDKLASELKSQKDLNVTEIKSITDRNYTNSQSCIADVTAVQQGAEVPLTVSFAECKGKIPIYAVTGGGNAEADMELFLQTFNC
jgi:hypothetical protein